MASTEWNDDKNTSGVRTLHDMFHIVGDQMTARDVKVLKFLYSAVLSRSLMEKINDGFSFFLALEKIGRIDDSNFQHILHLLRIITRHDLTPSLTLRKRKTVIADPVDEFLEQTARSNTIIPFKRKSSCLDERSPLPSSPSTSVKAQPSGDASNSKENSPRFETGDRSLSTNTDSVSSPPTKRLRRSPRNIKGTGVSPETHCSAPGGAGEPNSCIKTKLTCDIRLRVRAEYCHHDAALDGNVHSNKPELIERQFEKFMQANTILKSRDLGSIICDIKFSELTYLDAFWRDYINGSLLDALKGVFITESLKQAVGHEAIKLLVNVDEDDYEKGRLILLKNLRQ